jgi:hypothetical protein
MKRFAFVVLNVVILQALLFPCYALWGPSSAFAAGDNAQLLAGLEKLNSAFDEVKKKLDLIYSIDGKTLIPVQPGLFLDGNNTTKGLVVGPNEMLGYVENTYFFAGPFPEAGSVDVELGWTAATGCLVGVTEMGVYVSPSGRFMGDDAVNASESIKGTGPKKGTVSVGKGDYLLLVHMFMNKRLTGARMVGPMAMKMVDYPAEFLGAVHGPPATWRLTANFRPGAESVIPAVEELKKGLTLTVSCLPGDRVETSPGPKSTCRIEVGVHDEEGKALRGRVIELEAPPQGFGRINRLKAVTNVEGLVSFIYRAPDTEEADKQPGPSISLALTVRDVLTGAEKLVNLRILKAGSVEFTCKHAIVPAHPSAVQKIRIRYRGPARADGEPYEAKLIVKSAHGRLAEGDFGASGGQRELRLSLRPDWETVVAYRWEGPQPKAKSVTEEIRLKVPERKLDESTSFKVGTDPAIMSVSRRSTGPIYPFLADDFLVRVDDRLNPGADMEALFNGFPELRPCLDFREKFYEAVPVAEVEKEFLKALFQSFDSSTGSHFTGGFIDDGSVRKIGDDWFVIARKLPDGKAAPDKGLLPSIVFFKRGRYQFTVDLTHSPLDANDENNSMSSIVYEVANYGTLKSEVFDTVVLPISEFATRMAISLSSGPAVAAQLALSAADVNAACARKDWDGALVGTIEACFTAVNAKLAIDLAAVKQLKKSGKASAVELKNFLKTTRLQESMGKYFAATTLRTLSDRLEDLEEKLRGSSLPRSLWVSPAYGADKKSGGRADDPSLLRMASLLSKSLGSTGLCILDQKGLTQWKGKVGAVSLRGAPEKLSELVDEGQRIQRGKHVIIVPVDGSEKLELNLAGTGESGTMAVVGAGGVEVYSYPKKLWKEKFVFSGKTPRVSGSTGFQLVATGGTSTFSGNAPAATVIISTSAGTPGDTATISTSAGTPGDTATISLSDTFQTLDKKRWTFLLPGGTSGVTTGEKGLSLVHPGKSGWNRRGLVTTEPVFIWKDGLKPLSLTVRIPRKELGVETKFNVGLIEGSLVASDGKSSVDPWSRPGPIIQFKRGYLKVYDIGGGTKVRRSFIHSFHRELMVGARLIWTPDTDVWRFDLQTVEGKTVRSWKGKPLRIPEPGTPFYLALWGYGDPEGSALNGRIESVEFGELSH